MNWNKKEVEKIQRKVKGVSIQKSIKKPIPKSIGREKIYIEQILFYLLLDKKIPQYTPEYKFLENRRFKFDWALPSIKVAIEYEGLVSSKSRHTTITGYTGDCNKYILALS